MNICSVCGSAAADADRFCGDCGAPLGPDASPPQQAGEDRQGEEYAAPRRNPWGITAALSTLVLVAVGAGCYYLLVNGSAPGKTIRLAIGDLPFTSPEPEPDTTPTPSETASEAGDETASESATPEPAPSGSATPDSPALAAPIPADGAIMPGSWAFNTLLYNVTKVDMSDTSFRLSREGIGLSESSSQCVSPSLAANPGSGTFPFRPGMDCRASSFSMTGNRYRATLTCNFPQYGGRRPVEAEGRYSPDDISVNLRVRVPAQIVNGDFANPPEIYLHYRISGRRTQPC